MRLSQRRDVYGGSRPLTEYGRRARADRTHGAGSETGWSDVEGVLDDALEYGMRACIPPCYVAEAVGTPTCPW